MQPYSFFARALTATAALLFVAESHAALNYDEGNLIMAFRATGGTGAATNFLVNLGPKDQFVNATSVITITTQLGNFKADLDALYTASWKTRVDFMWSVTGVHQVPVGIYAANTIFASKARAIGATSGLAGSTAWTAPSVFGAGNPAGKVLELGLRYEAGTGSTESTNSAFALIQPEAVTQSYRSYMPGGANTTASTAFNYFSGVGTIEAPLAQDLDFYTLTPGGGAREFEGSFSLASNGTVTFTPAAAVPEPTAFVAIGGGLFALTSIRRRSRQS